MPDDQPQRRSEADAELEREIREGRKFSLAEAIGRLAGPGMMKGVSPVARMQQAEVELENYLDRHLVDGAGALQAVLLRLVRQSELFVNNYEQPLVVLASYVQRVLDNDFLLQEVVREADAEWGRVYEERPYFEIAGRAPHEDDPYTLEGVRQNLSQLKATLTTS
jgi:hypothetical protein